MPDKASPLPLSGDDMRTIVDEWAQLKKATQDLLRIVDKTPTSAYDSRLAEEARALITTIERTNYERAARIAGRVPSTDSAAGEDRWLTSRQVLELLRSMGRPIAASTWSAYVARGQAPTPGRYVGRTPQWDRAAVEQFAGSPA